MDFLLVTYRSSPKGKAVDGVPPSRAHVFLETRKNRKTEPTRMDEKSTQAVLHSVFLDVRKLRRMAGIRITESGTVKVECVLNWFTFIFARLIPYALILIKLVRDASKFDKGMENLLICQPLILRVFMEPELRYGRTRC
ncbi:uncharacterized protein LOC141606373 [Silene latifolia]|uniref:uncharacterized protein LOC141606373 n=1 Tax=Silene latifolia TaxID=37657 RepID=UPI003D777AB4